MKKSVVAVALTGVLGVAAHAATVSEFANGVLVPRVIDEGSGNSTAIGLTSCANGTVYWTFFDPDTKHVLDDEFGVTADQQVNLVWNSSLNPGTTRVFGGQGVQGEEGYLVFVLDTTGDVSLQASTSPGISSDIPCLAGAAFQVDLGESDVSFIPAMPLDIRPVGAGDFLDLDGDGIYVNDLRDMDEVDVAGLNAGANANDTVYMRYFIREATDDTKIHIWSAQDLRGTYTVNIYDTDQNRRSVNLDLTRAELNTIDPRPIIGRPATFVDGFIKWIVPECSNDEGGHPRVVDCGPSTNLDLVRGVVSWSVISSDTFGATQTIVNPIRLVKRVGNIGVPGFRVRVIEDGDDEVDNHGLEVQIR